MIDFEEFAESIRRIYSDPLLKSTCLQAAVDLFGGSETLAKQVFTVDASCELLIDVAAVADSEIKRGLSGFENEKK